MTNGPGARIVVPAPPKGIPLVSLLTSAQPADALPEGDDPLRWLNGIAYVPQTCAGGQAYAVGCTPEVGQTSHARAADESMPGVIYTNPFGVTAYDECSALGWEERNFQKRATDLLATVETALVEREFWSGEKLKAYATTQGITIGEHDSDKLPAQWLAQTVTLGNGGASLGTYTKPLAGIARITEATADCNDGVPAMFHFAEGLRPIIERYYTVKRDGNKLVDSQGNIWVPGAGYPNTGPDGTPAAADHYWIYSTSMVRFWRSDPRVFPGNYAQALVRDGSNQHLNLLRFWSDREYLLDWDRCCHFAVELDISTIS